MPSDRFLPGPDTLAVYRLVAPLPVSADVALTQYTLGLELSEVPPFVDSWLRRPGDFCVCWLGRYESLEHAHYHFRHGYEVECPSLLELLFERLVAEGTQNSSQAVT